MGPKGVSNAPSEPHIGPGLALFLTCVGLCRSYMQHGGAYVAGASISGLLTLLCLSIFKNKRTTHFEIDIFEAQNMVVTAASSRKFKSDLR
jgi:hypothetical protein